MPLNYATLKAIHISAVALSFGGFMARGLGVLSGASWVRHRLARTLPQLIDSVLLLSALNMLWLIHLLPWAMPWLRAKLLGLVVYIVLGVVALRPTSAGSPIRPRRVRLFAWLAAVVIFSYIVSVAYTKNPCGALVWCNW